jgi:predicted choloylglycine hydrolase
MIKSRRMRWAGRVTRIGERGMHTGYWWESQKERDQFMGGWIILKWILEKCDRVVQTGVIWLRIGTSGGLL